MGSCVRAAARTVVSLLMLLSLGAGSGWARQADASISGVVLDPLGARVAGARVTVLRDGVRGATSVADAQGAFTVRGVTDGRYQLEVTAGGFATRVTSPFYVGANARTVMDVTLQIGPLNQDVVVSAAAAALPQAQVGASVTVVDKALMDACGKYEVFEAVRTVPGAQVVQVGARGGTTSVFLRGGNPAFTKVLVDGVPMNDIGGAFNFASLESTGVDRVEVLRGSNSVLYGVDAMSGVVNITTERGHSVHPAVQYTTEGGNFGSTRQAGSIGGAYNRFDYFSAYSFIDTNNNVANNAFRNNTYAGRFGAALGAGTDLSVTIRHSQSDYGSPNATDYYGVADDSTEHSADTAVGVTARSQLSTRLSTTIRVSSATQLLRSNNPSPNGEAFDPFGFGASYLGNLVTVRGANGTSATGQAILDYGGDYPQFYNADTSRRSLFAQADYQIASALNVAGGLRYDHESGKTDSTFGGKTAVTHDNTGAFVEARASAHRVYVNAGLGVDHNAVFKTAVTPRVSVAAYVRTPSASATVGETKVTFNAGQGTKAPSVSQELQSLYALLSGKGLQLASGISPIGPERSTGVDAGIEQALFASRVRARVSYFDNRFSDLIEYVNTSVLPQLGIPKSEALSLLSSAYVNAQSYTARGLETSVDALVAPRVRVMASYMFLDAEVTKSFSSGALNPAINPAYPDTPIGAFAPLVGGRPFRRPAHSGNLAVMYSARQFQAFVSAYFSGKFDESTFLSDAFFGNSLLLPNRDLGAAYRKVDANLSYAFTPAVRAYATIENLLDAKYEAASGFPALGRAARAGLRLNFGGDRVVASPSVTAVH